MAITIWLICPGNVFFPRRHSHFGAQTSRLVEKRVTPAAVAPRQHALRKHRRQQIVKVSNAAATPKVSVENGDIVKGASSCQSLRVNR
jgi:hypothetical protein